jgi:Ni/Co efflux regulator RcnB
MKRILIAAAILSVVGGAAASAQPYDRDRDGVPNRYDRDRDNDGVPNRYDNRPNDPRNGARPYGDRDRDGVPNAYDRRPNDPRNGARAYGDRDRDGIPNAYDRRDNRYSYGGRYYDRWRGPAYAYPRGFQPRRWDRGQYLPRAYFASPYYIDNYAYYRLRPPPRGYRYVRVGNDIVLAAIAGGLIAEVINGAFY